MSRGGALGGSQSALGTSAGLVSDLHVSLPRGVRLEAVFRLEQTRTVSNDWVVRYDTRLFQVERQSHRPPARGTVLAYEAADGEIEIRYRGRVMRCTEVLPEEVAPKPAGPRPPTGAASSARVDSHSAQCRSSLEPRL